jgi:hypothetical protein
LLTFDGNRYVPNTSQELSVADVEELRQRGHTLIEDVAPGPEGALQTILAQRQAANDNLQAQLAVAVDAGDHRLISTLQPQSWEAAGLLRAALEARDRERANPTAAAIPAPARQQALQW